MNGCAYLLKAFRNGEKIMTFRVNEKPSAMTIFDKIILFLSNDHKTVYMMNVGPLLDRRD